MSSKPPRPFWKRKRWIVAAVLWLWLPVLADLSIGPTIYCCRRGWVGPDFGTSIYWPLSKAWSYAPANIRMMRYHYAEWWNRLGKRHRDAAASR